MNQPILWYFADPMCSWCWGFSPTIETLKHTYQDKLKVALVLGGLRAGTTDPMTPQQREDILHHWHAVQKHTGQTFQFESAMPEGFIYDTEPACRGVVAISESSPELTFPFFKAVQSAFYVKNQDVTQPEVLAKLAKELGVDPKLFLEAFHSEETKHKTLAHFHKAREWGVRGFPTLVLQSDSKYHLLSKGYSTEAELKEQIDPILAEKQGNTNKSIQ